MYTTKNYKTKKELKQDISDRNRLLATEQPDLSEITWLDQLNHWLTPYQPGLGSVPQNGTALVEGPHYPKPHKWYAAVVIKDSIIVKAS